MFNFACIASITLWPTVDREYYLVDKLKSQNFLKWIDHGDFFFFFGQEQMLTLCDNNEGKEKKKKTLRKRHLFSFSRCSLVCKHGIKLLNDWVACLSSKYLSPKWHFFWNATIWIPFLEPITSHFSWCPWRVKYLQKTDHQMTFSDTRAIKRL